MNDPRATDPDRALPALAETARQFGEHARQYAVSRAHLEGTTRVMLLERMEPVADETLLDIGSGPGPVAIAFAPYVARAVAYDAAPEMLVAARLAARRAAVANLETVRGDAHRLPFADRAFGLVTSRACPHHFTDIRAAVAEMARVLARGGRLGIADGTVPDDPEIDAFLNRLDTLHDPTTVRNYSAREWRGIVEGAGLRVDVVEDYVVELPEGRSLLDWLARSGASSAIAEECRRMLLQAPAKVRDYLRVRPDGDDVNFELPRVVMVAKRVD
ncbi:MAG: methyltransferase domain-containing protein [Candidatus Eisenbacteria bacterium]|uniref:Methyltransferase domain-containing protein n=1 Tax=Eiseniibacteriota bacterium TaxID=2212470 RepID=A0A538U8B7_UNCEI|nr:MAG: methyltransferase domain-containing protein [Candidatus Eisenbacteria bacterium]